VEWVLSGVGTLLVVVGLWDLLRQKLTGAPGILKIGRGGEARAPVAFLVLLVGAGLLVVGAVGIKREVSGARTSRPTTPQRPGGDREKICTKACELSASCGFVLPNCVQSCLASEANVACARTQTTCDEAASCLISGACGGGRPPSGDLTCALGWKRATNVCAFGDVACGCEIAAQLAPAAASEWAMLTGCLAACGNPACLTGACAPYVQACLAN
jgi:hypothetical protein